MLDTRGQDPKKNFEWLIETGLQEYLVQSQEEGGALADGGGLPGLECVDSPLVQHLLAKVKAKKGGEIEPQSMDYGQCPYAPARGWRARCLACEMSCGVCATAGAADARRSRGARGACV